MAQVRKQPPNFQCRIPQTFHREWIFDDQETMEGKQMKSNSGAYDNEFIQFNPFPPPNQTQDIA